MGDIALEWLLGSADLVTRDGDLASDEGLHTAIILSLFLDRRAEPDDALPAGDGDRRGSWDDEFSAVQGDRGGSRLWLLERSTLRADIIPLAEEYVREALAWMIEDRVVDRFDVDAETGKNELLLAITPHRPGRDPVTFRFAHVWESLSPRPPAQDASPAPPIDSEKPGPVSTLGFTTIGNRGQIALGSPSRGRDMRAYLNQLGWF